MYNIDLDFESIQAGRSPLKTGNYNQLKASVVLHRTLSPLPATLRGVAPPAFGAPMEMSTVNQQNSGFNQQKPCVLG